MTAQTFQQAVSMMSDNELRDEIRRKQDIQKRVGPKSEYWHMASDILAVCFSEAHKRNLTPNV